MQSTKYFTQSVVPIWSTALCTTALLNWMYNSGKAQTTFWADWNFQIYNKQIKEKHQWQNQLGPLKISAKGASGLFSAISIQTQLIARENPRNCHHQRQSGKLHPFNCYVQDRNVELEPRVKANTLVLVCNLFRKWTIGCCC